GGRASDPLHTPQQQPFQTASDRIGPHQTASDRTPCFCIPSTAPLAKPPPPPLLSVLTTAHSLQHVLRVAVIQIRPSTSVALC
ncbi:hypothetical protein E4U19_004630, partial [Claviceps sp. Clav32 group G5]